MRSFSFIAKNIGRERYLTYVMGEGMELDEDVLDYCEDNEIDEILNIIYEEDDDYDYLTYDVSGKMTLEKYTEGVIDKEKVFNLLRNVAINMINIKEHAIPLSYILLNKSFMYVDPDTLELEFLYLPVESDASVSMEFKSFVRQLMASLKYNVDEDLAYVGQLLAYINGDKFNLRGLINLTEAMMKDSAIAYGAESDISTSDGAEVISDTSLNAEAEKGAMDFMKDLGEVMETLPEIGDDGEEEEVEAPSTNSEADKKVAAKIQDMIDAETKPEEIKAESKEEPKKESKEEPKVESKEEPKAETKTEVKEEAKTDEKAETKAGDNAEDAKNVDNGSVTLTRPVKVSRAAVLKAAADHVDDEAPVEAAGDAAEQISESSKNQTEKKTDVVEELPDAAKKEGTGSGLLNSLIPGNNNDVVDNTIQGNEGTVIKINPYITRVETGERVMITKPVFKIGKASRGVDFHVGGNGAISRQHAFILHKGDSYYLKDNKSTNHSYVDGKQVEGDEEVLLKNNSTIRLGDEDFTFKLS